MNDGKFWGPITDGNSVIGWQRVDEPVPGAAEMRESGLALVHLVYERGAVRTMSQEEACAMLASTAKAETDALVAAEVTLAAADETARKDAEAEETANAERLAKVEAVRSATSVEAKLDAVIAYLGLK